MLELTPRKRWLLIGALGCLAVVALGWLLLVRSQNTQRADLEAQAADAQIQLATTRSKVEALKADNTHLPRYRAQLAALTAALPATPSSAQLVTEVQRLSTRSNVFVTALSVTPPTGTSSVATGGAQTLPVTISVIGTPARMEGFLDRLENTSSRALQVATVTEAVPVVTAGAGTTAYPTLTITANAYYLGS